MLTTYAGVNQAIADGQCYKTSWAKTGGSTYVAGFWYNTFALAGQPSAGSYTGSARTATPCYGSAGPWGAATPGKISCAENVGVSYSGNDWYKHVLSMEMSTVTATGAPAWLILIDMLMYYPSIDMNSGSQQAMTNVATLPRYTDGAGVKMFLEATTALGATPVNLSSAQTVPANGFTYTDASGTPNSFLPGTVAIGAAAGSRAAQSISHGGLAANTFGPFIPMAAGDTGVRSVENFQLTAGTGSASSAALVLCKPLATIPLISSTAPATTAAVRDFIFNMPGFPQVHDGACLSFIICPGAAAVTATWQGILEFVWG
jgi:hypothetical protein